MRTNTHLSAKIVQNWILNCSVGEFLGILCAAVLAVMGNHFIGEQTDIGKKVLLFMIALLSGVCEGSLLAYFQHRILRGILPNLRFKLWWQYTYLMKQPRFG